MARVSEVKETEVTQRGPAGQMIPEGFWDFAKTSLVPMTENRKGSSTINIYQITGEDQVHPKMWVQMMWRPPGAQVQLPHI